MTLDCLILLILMPRRLVLSAGEREYYERQFGTLKSFEEVDILMASDSSEEDDLEDDLKERAQQERAMQISNFANIILLAFKVVVLRYID